MTHDPLWEPKYTWYKACVTESCKYPTGSVPHIFWWSMRYELSRDENIKMWAENPKEAFREWLEYMAYKWETLAHHRASPPGWTCYD